MFIPILCSLLVAAGTALAQSFSPPVLTGPVVDNAHIIDADTAAAIENGLRQLRDSGGTQINVLTVESLGGLTIEQASIQVTDKWKLGGEKTDNGVLLMIAPNERKVRIEVGQGLEGSLTDAYSNRIIRDIILPRFKSGDYSDGILQGVVGIIRYTNPEIDPSTLFSQRASRQVRDQGDGGSWFPFIFFFILFLFMIFGRGGRGGRGGRISPWTAGALGYGLGRSSGGWGGGGFGGGGGGGWSGGGGGFSGGGSSGSW